MNTVTKQLREDLLVILKRDAFVREKITLSSGKESDYYIDARRVTLSAEGAYLCAHLILETLEGEDIEAIGGPTLGADPMLGAIGVVSFERKRPLKTFIIRKTPKKYGRQQQVEGPLLSKGANVVLIDDVATTGGSFLQSIDVLKSMDIEVQKAVCLVDRQEGAKEALAAKGCDLIALFTSADFGL